MHCKRRVVLQFWTLFIRRMSKLKCLHRHWKLNQWLLIAFRMGNYFVEASDEIWLENFLAISIHCLWTNRWQNALNEWQKVLWQRVLHQNCNMLNMMPMFYRSNVPVERIMQTQTQLYLTASSASWYFSHFVFDIVQMPLRISLHCRRRIETNFVHSHPPKRGWITKRHQLYRTVMQQSIMQSKDWNYNNIWSITTFDIFISEYVWRWQGWHVHGKLHQTCLTNMIFQKRTQ